MASHDRDPGHVACRAWLGRDYGDSGVRGVSAKPAGRSRAWAFLPLPALALWVGASGLGCMRAYGLPGTHVAGIGEMRDCLLFIIGLSVPLSAALMVMLRRAYSLWPALTAAMAGLASAAAAATLLNFFHPFDAAAADLAVHSVAMLIVVAAARAVGTRTLQNSFAAL